MGAINFSKGEAFQFGWTTVKSNIGIFVSVFIVAFLILYGIPYIVAIFAGNSIPAAVFLVIISTLSGVFATLGLLNIALQFCNNKKAEFADFFNVSSLYVPYLAGSFLFGLTMVGLFILPIVPVFILKNKIAFLLSVALFVPAVVVICRLQFYGFIIIDNKVGPIEALKKSYEITKGAVWNLFLFSILIVLVNMLGCIALVIGLFVTVPISLIAYAHVYRSLAGQPKTITKQKTKNLRVIEKTFNPDVDIFSMTREEFTQRLKNEQSRV